MMPLSTVGAIKRLVPKLRTGSQKIDLLLDGGIEPSTITMIYGEGGTGKTNLCLMVSRNAVLDGFKVVYIDTEGVSMDRLRQLCGAEFDKVSRNILFSTPYDFTEQTKLIEKGIKLIESRGKIGLIVVDSLTMLFRSHRADEQEDRKELNEQLSMLLSAARKNDIPVLITSQVYTNIDRGTFEPLGGHAINHAAKTILMFEKIENRRRMATLVKHRYLRDSEHVEFSITQGGIE
ncbi:MAG: DNA repair and recombination protein RadB [Thermoplasmata archaeon]|nr:DNA repair and recombination protein RadB [Candidatus Sysuiplasma acidicola]